MSLNNTPSHPKGNYIEVNERRMTQKKKNWASAINISRLHTDTDTHSRAQACTLVRVSSAREWVANLYTPPLCSNRTWGPNYILMAFSLLLAPQHLWVRGNKMKLSTFPILVSFCLMCSRFPVHTPTALRSCTRNYWIHCAKEQYMSNGRPH